MFGCVWGSGFRLSFGGLVTNHAPAKQQNHVMACHVMSLFKGYFGAGAGADHPRFPAASGRGGALLAASGSGPGKSGFAIQKVQKKLLFDTLIPLPGTQLDGGGRHRGSSENFSRLKNVIGEFTVAERNL